MSQSQFSSLDLHPDFLKNLDSLGYESMTPVQKQSLPPILNGDDVIAQGKTGSGKTAAFALGILSRLQPKRFCVQSLVLCPTRELADQVAQEIRRLARAIPNVKVLTTCGGTPLGPQVNSLESGVHIVVGTPGRVEDHLERDTLNLDSVQMLVLDEADRMLQMGFQESIDMITARVPKQRQTLLLSATYPEEIKSIARRVMKSPVMVKVDIDHDESSIAQHFYKLEDNAERLVALRLLLLRDQPASALVFCNTRDDVRSVAAKLAGHGFSALALHGELEQRERDQILTRFANKSVSILVATDVAARGLDIDSLDVVVNFHLARDTEVHVHRIGRTGRAGGSGLAWSFFGHKDGYRIACLQDVLGRKISGESLPQPKVLHTPVPQPPMTTLQIEGGKKQKLRPGDILGALTGEQGIAGSDVGKIRIFDNRTFVAVKNDAAKAAVIKLGQGKLKGRSFRVRLVSLGNAIR